MDRSRRIRPTPASLKSANEAGLGCEAVGVHAELSGRENVFFPIVREKQLVSRTTLQLR